MYRIGRKFWGSHNKRTQLCIYISEYSICFKVIFVFDFSYSPTV